MAVRVALLFATIHMVTAKKPYYEQITNNPLLSEFQLLEWMAPPDLKGSYKDTGYQNSVSVNRERWLVNGRNYYLRLGYTHIRENQYNDNFHFGLKSDNTNYISKLRNIEVLNEAVPRLRISEVNYNGKPNGEANNKRTYKLSDAPGDKGIKDESRALNLFEDMANHIQALLHFTTSNAFLCDNRMVHRVKDVYGGDFKIPVTDVGTPGTVSHPGTLKLYKMGRREKLLTMGVFDNVTDALVAGTKYIIHPDLKLTPTQLEVKVESPDGDIKNINIHGDNDKLYKLCKQVEFHFGHTQEEVHELHTLRADIKRKKEECKAADDRMDDINNPAEFDRIWTKILESDRLEEQMTALKAKTEADVAAEIARKEQELSRIKTEIAAETEKRGGMETLNADKGKCEKMKEDLDKKKVWMWIVIAVGGFLTLVNLMFVCYKIVVSEFQDEPRRGDQERRRRHHRRKYDVEEGRPRKFKKKPRGQGKKYKRHRNERY